MRRRAFTLIELMVVVIVIAVLSGMAITSFGGSLNKTRLAESAQRLHTVVRYAHRYALTHRCVCRITFKTDDPDDGPGYKMEVESTDPDATDTFTVIQSGVGKPVKLTGKLRFAKVLIENGDLGQQYVITFQPTGEANAAAIQLTDGKRTWTVLIEPNTSRSRVVDHAVDQIPNMREDLDA